MLFKDTNAQIMKKYNLLILVLIFLSCSKSNENILLGKDNIIGKWTVSNQSKYKSVEFNTSRNYIILIEEDQIEEIKFGEYEIINDEIRLDNFGVIDGVNFNNNQISFLIKNPDGESIQISALKKLDLVQFTSLNIDLCKTWNLVLKNDMPVIGTENELYTFISESGTYFFYKSMINESFLSNWNWKDINEMKFCYSHDGETLCEEDENIVQIMQLTENELIALDIVEEDIYVFEALE
jgi:hypothetical protein